MLNITGNGIIEIPGSSPVDNTVEKLKAILKAKGVTLFALIDHSGEAEKVGIAMRPHQAAHLRQPQSRHTPHARVAQRRY